MMKMPKILDCMMVDCAYNKEEKCHAIAITVGGGVCPFCDTAITGAAKGGVMNMTGAVGACKVSNCQFNDSLECGAHSIRVTLHEQHAECGTFKAK